MDHQMQGHKIRTQDTCQRSELLRRQELDRKIVALKKRQRLTASYQLIIFVGSCLPTFILLSVCRCRIIWESCFGFMFFVSAIFGMLAFCFSNKRWNIVYMTNLVLSFFCALPMMLLSVLAVIDKTKYHCNKKNIETCKNIMTVILCVNIMLAFVEVVVIFTALKISSRIILKLDERNVMNSNSTRNNLPDDDVISKGTLDKKSLVICDNKAEYYATWDNPAGKDVDYSEVPSSPPPIPPPLPPISSSEPSFQIDSSAPTSVPRYTIPTPPQPPAIVPPAGFGNVGSSYVNDDLCMTGYVNTVGRPTDPSTITSGYVEMHKSTVKQDKHEQCKVDNEYLEMKENAQDEDNKSIKNTETQNIAYEPFSTSEIRSPAKLLDLSPRQHSYKPRPKPRPKPKKHGLRNVRPSLLYNDTNQLRINMKPADNEKEDEDNEGYLQPTDITAIKFRREANLRKNVEGGIVDIRPKKMSPNRKILRRSRSEPFLNVIDDKCSVICRTISIDDVNILTNSPKDDVITQKEEESSHYIELWKTSTLSKSESFSIVKLREIFES